MESSDTDIQACAMAACFCEVKLSPCVFRVFSDIVRTGIIDISELRVLDTTGGEREESQLDECTLMIRLLITIVINSLFGSL